MGERWAPRVLAGLLRGGMPEEELLKIPTVSRVDVEKAKKQFRNVRKIPDGKTYVEILVESASAFPNRVFKDLDVKPFQIIADRNSRGDRIVLGVSLKPKGCKTARHPQVVFYVKGDYHLETLAYYRSNPFDWTTWIQFYMDARDLKKLIDALIRIELTMEKGGLVF